VRAEKKWSGGYPKEFLCSQIYDFWGLLITADEQQRPANEARIGKRYTFTSLTLKSKGYMHPLLTSLAGLCHSSIAISNPQKLEVWLRKNSGDSPDPFSPPPHKKKKKVV